MWFLVTSKRVFFNLIKTGMKTREEKRPKLNQKKSYKTARFSCYTPRTFTSTFALYEWGHYIRIICTFFFSHISNIYIYKSFFFPTQLCFYFFDKNFDVRKNMWVHVSMCALQIENRSCGWGWGWGWESLLKHCVELWS